MSVIYLEGGGSGSRNTTKQCRKAFRQLMQKMGIKTQPKLIAGGSRGNVYDMFCVAQASGEAAFVAMWIDAEEPMSDPEQAWAHLQRHDHWSRPAGATDEQVLLMTTCMETWIATDQSALEDYYHQKLNKKPLPPPTNIESRDRASIYHALVMATRKCPNKYTKGERSFEVFEKLDPAVLRQHLPSFARVERILKKKL